MKGQKNKSKIIQRTKYFIISLNFSFLLFWTNREKYFLCLRHYCESLDSYFEMCNRKCLFSCRVLAAGGSGSQSGFQSASPTALNVKNTEKTPGAFLRPRDIQSPTVTDRTCVCVRARACANRASLRGWRAWRPHTLRIAPPPNTHTHGTKQHTLPSK